MSSVVGCPRRGGSPDNRSATEGETGKPGPSPNVADAHWRPRITSDYWRIWFYLLEAAGLSVQLVNARDVKNAPGRPKTDKLDAVWLAKLTERGMLRPSFVPPAEIRRLRDYTRLRTDLTRDRTRCFSRLEKLLEDSLIKVSSVASSLDTKSVRDMIEALIAGERDPGVLAGLARGKMKAKRAALVRSSGSVWTSSPACGAWMTWPPPRYITTWPGFAGVPSEPAENSRSPGWICGSGICGPSCRQPKVVRAMRMPAAA